MYLIRRFINTWNKKNILLFPAGCRALDAVEVKDISIETLGDAEAAAEGSIISSWIFQEYKAKDKKKTLPKVSLYGNEGE